MVKFIDKLGLAAIASKIKTYIDDSIQAFSETFENATQEYDGLMSKEDKIKLDGLESVMTYKGSVNEYSALPTENRIVGDTWNVISAYESNPAGSNYVWNGSEWDCLGGIIDFSKLQEKRIVIMPDISFPEDSFILNNIEISSFILPDGVTDDVFTYIYNTVSNGSSITIASSDRTEYFNVVNCDNEMFVVASSYITVTVLKTSNTTCRAVAAQTVRDNATTLTSGLMSTEDKTRLDSLWDNLGNIIDAETQRY